MSSTRDSVLKKKITASHIQGVVVCCSLQKELKSNEGTVLILPSFHGFILAFISIFTGHYETQEVCLSVCLFVFYFYTEMLGYTFLIHIEVEV